MARISISQQLKRMKETERVVELREANVPMRIIGKQLGIGEHGAQKRYKDYYARQREIHEGQRILRRYERQQQLESMDARLGMLIQHGPDPKSLAAQGYTFKDFMAAMECSRRIKADLSRLHGLNEEVSQAASANANPVMTEFAKMSAVREWLDGIENTDKELKDFIVARLTADMNAQPRPDFPRSDTASSHVVVASHPSPTPESEP